MGKKKPILLSAAALAVGVNPALAQTATDVTSKITNPSFETKGGAGWTNNGFSLYQGNSALASVVGNYYAEKWIASGSKLSNSGFKQTIKLPAGYYELTAIGSLQDQKNNKDGVKGFFLYAGSDQVEFGEEGTYCVPFTMSSDGNIEIGVKTVDAQGNWARVDNFQLVTYDISLDDYKSKQTLALSIAINKANKYTNDATLQTLALKASEIQIKINNLKNFSETAETRAEIEKEITDFSQAVTNAAANYEAYAKAQSLYGNEYKDNSWTPVSPATGLLAKKASLEEAWKKADAEVKANADAKKLYDDNIALIQAYIDDATTAYNAQKATQYDAEEIYKNTVASVDEAIKAITTGSANAIQNAATVKNINAAISTYDNKAKALYEALVDPNYNSDGSTYTDYYTQGLAELNDALRTINAIKKENNDLYEAGNCTSKTTSDYKTKLDEATGKLDAIVKEYSDNATAWRANYKAANAEIAALTKTYKTNVVDVIGSAKNSKNDKDGFYTKKADLQSAFTSAATAIVNAIQTIQDNVDAANKAHTIGATEYYKGYGEAKKAVENQVKTTDGTLTKKASAALAEYKHLLSAWDNYLYIAWERGGVTASEGYNLGYDVAKAAVEAAKSADGKYAQTGRFEYLETPITTALAKLEADRVAAYNAAKKVGFLGTQGDACETAVKKAIGGTKSVTTGTIFADIKAYADQAAKTLGQYNTVSDYLTSYDHAINGYDEYYTEAEIKAAKKGDAAYGKKTTDVKEHHAGLIETATNTEVTTDGTLNGTTYAAAIKEIQDKIAKLQGEVDAAIAATSKGKAHVDAVAALKAIDGYPTAIETLKDNYSTMESKWNQNNLDAAKARLIDEGQHLINNLSSEYTVKNQYADAESITPIVVANKDTYEAATYGKQADTDVYYTQKEIDAAKEGDAAYGKKTTDIKTPSLNTRLAAVKKTQAELQKALDEASAKGAAEAIPVLTQINSDIADENKVFTALQTDATNIAANYLAEKKANNELKAQVQDDLTDYVAGNDTKKITSLLGLLPENNVNTKNPIATEKGNMDTEIGSYVAGNKGVLGNIKDYFDAETLVANKSKVETTINTVKTKITNLRTLAQNEYDNTEKSSTWDKDVKAADFENKKTPVKTGIDAVATGDGKTFFDAEYNKIATASTGTYYKLIAAAENAKKAVAKAYVDPTVKNPVLLPGSLDQAIYTDYAYGKGANMTVKYDELKLKLDNIMSNLNGLVERATKNETAHTAQVNAYDNKTTKKGVKYDRDEIFNTINNAEKSSYTETAVKEVLAIDELIKKYNADVADNFGKGTCDVNKSDLESQMTAIETRLKTLKDGWNDNYKNAVASDNAERYATFNTYYSDVLTKTYSEQVDMFTAMSKLSYASDLQTEYDEATGDTKYGVYKMATTILDLKKAVKADYEATNAPDLWDATEANLEEAENLKAEIVARVKKYCDAVNAQAKTTWETARDAAQKKLADANSAIKSTLGLTGKTKDVEAIINNAISKAEDTNFAYELDNEILPAFKTIDDKLLADKNNAAIDAFNAKIASVKVDAEKTAIAGFHGEDGTLGAFSKQYQTDVIDNVEASKTFWAKVESGKEFENYTVALAKGFNSVVMSSDKDYKGYTEIYEKAAKADKAFHANDQAYLDSKALIAGEEKVLGDVKDFVNSMFAKYNSDLVAKFKEFDANIANVYSDIESAHASKSSESYLATLKSKKTATEAAIVAVETTAIEKEQAALNSELPSLRHDYEQASAKVIGDETKAAEFEAKGYTDIINGYVDEILKIYSDFTNGKKDAKGNALYEKDGKTPVKATAEETRLAYIALEHKMAKTKDELAAYYDATAASTDATALQKGIDDLTSYYNGIVTDLQNAHDPVVKEFQSDADALNAEIAALQTEFDGYKAVDGELFYDDVMATSINNVKSKYADLKDNIKTMEDPYDQFDADKNAINNTLNDLESKLAAVYAKCQAYEHQQTGKYSIGTKGEEDYQEFDNYAAYTNAELALSIQIQKDALAKEIAPNKIDVDKYNANAESIEKKYNNYFEYPTYSIENMDGYFAYYDNAGYHSDVIAVVDKVSADIDNYKHLPSMVKEFNAEIDRINTALNHIWYYNRNLASSGYSPVDIDGNAYTAQTEDAVNLGTKDDPNWVKYEDLPEVSPTIVEKLKALIDDANALLSKAEESHIQRGDVKRDDVVNIDDYQKLALAIINDEVKNFDEMEKYCADANEDDKINVGDLSAIVNIISNDFISSGKASAFLAEESSANDAITAEVNDNVLALGINNAVAYTGFQMDITLPSGASVSSEALTERANGQEIIVNNIGGNTYRVLVMGTDNAAFNGNNGAIANLKLDNMHGTAAISNVVFTDAKANAYYFELGNSATAVSGVNAQQSAIEKIYSVGGQVRNALGRGVNIIKSNGVVKKIMNK